MPSLKQRLRSETPEGYAAQAELPSLDPTPKEPGLVLAGNKYIRTPLPPFNATSDTLRQFNENGKVPARRVIPLPPPVAGGGTTTIVNNTNVSSTSGGGNAPVAVAAKTITFSVATLIPGAVALLTLTVTEIAVLMLIGASDLCEVRIYGSSLAQAIDSPRASDTAPPFEITQGLVTDVILDTAPLQFNWQNRLFVNQDAPQKPIMYVTVVNPTLSAVTPSITITYLPLE